MCGCSSFSYIKVDVYILHSFVFYFLPLSLSRSPVLYHCLVPVDSSMFLSVTECNWFCQGQSIAPRHANSTGDRRCITVKRYSGNRNETVFVPVCVCFNRNRDDVVIHWPTDQVKPRYKVKTDQWLWGKAAERVGPGGNWIYHFTEVSVDL